MKGWIGTMTGFSLRQLEHFVAVVEEGSVTEAASRLRVSAGGISVSLKQLESSLGVQLSLRRRGQGVSITPAGKWVYEEAISILERSHELEKVARAIRGELTGSLRVGCFSTLSPWLFPRIAEHFVVHHPGIDLELVEGSSSELQGLLSSGDLDAALLYENHLESGIQGQRVIPVRLQLAFAPEHRLASFKEVPLKELQGEYAILLGVQPSMSHVEQLIRNAGIRPNVRWRSQNVETIRSMVARGLGYTIIMGRPYGDRTYDGLEIVYRPIADRIDANAVVVALPENARPTAKVTALIRLCRDDFGTEGELGPNESFGDRMGTL